MDFIPSPEPVFKSLIENPYGYIYITENLINHKRYIGQHRSIEFDPEYIGSGVIISKAVSKYGQENFSCYPIDWCSSIKELNDAEIRWIEKYNAAYDPSFYNISRGGTGHLMTEENKRKNSETQKIVQMRPAVREAKRRALLGKSLSEETCKKLSEFQSVHQNDPIYKEHLNRTKKNNKQAGKPVMCIETGEQFPSSLDAARSLGYKSHSLIASCVRSYERGDKSDTAYGYHWRYIYPGGAKNAE